MEGNKISLVFCVAIFLLFSTSDELSASGNSAEIERLQSPAWVKRGERLRALSPGFPLQAGDELSTGAGGRLLIQTSDGSHVKLGSNAKFVMEKLQSGNQSSVFKGVWRVLHGAFRYTTTVLGTNRKRDVSITVGIASIGIRGTDIWGKSNEEQDLVCLIEGEIEVSRGNDAPVSMAEPLSVYTAPRGGPANPLGTVDVPELQQWAAETEIDSGQGVLQLDGQYNVILLSSKKQSYAKKMQQRFQAEGYPAELLEYDADGIIWHRVGIKNFASFDDAKSFATQIEGVLGITGAWVNN